MGFLTEGLGRAIRGGLSVVGRLFRGRLSNNLDGDKGGLSIRGLLKEARVCSRQSKRLPPLEKGGISGAASQWCRRAQDMVWSYSD